MPANFENSTVTTGLEKISFHSNPKECNARKCSDYHTIALIPHAGKVILKSLHARLLQSVNQEIPVYKLCFKEAEEPTSSGSSKKQEDSRKTSTFASLTMLKPLTVCITTNCGKFLKRWECQTTLPVSLETCMQVKKEQLEPDMEQQTGSKLGKEHITAICCHPAYLTYM